MHGIPPLEYWPARHIEQLLEANEDPYPAGQFIQDIIPPVEYLPAGQDAHFFDTVS